MKLASDLDTSEALSRRRLLTPLRDDGQFVRFVVARSLLVPTALAPPFLIALAEGGGKDFSGLGPFVLASATASILSSYLWGRFSDNSSRRTIAFSGVICAAVLVAAALIASGDDKLQIGLIALLLFIFMIGYEGVRTGRKIHLVDMAKESDRARYTALSNTIIGGVLLLEHFAIMLRQVSLPLAYGSNAKPAKLDSR